jgi:hypothetical protein
VQDHSDTSPAATTRVAIVELVPRPAQRSARLGQNVELVCVEILGVQAGRRQKQPGGRAYRVLGRCAGLLVRPVGVAGRSERLALLSVVER